MKKKINLLIIASILGLLALSIIQAYLINNTYKLKKDVFVNETRRSISRLDDFSPTLDSLTSIWQDKFLNTLADYKNKNATKFEVIKSLQLVIDSINEPFKQEYQQELRKNNIPHGIKFHKKVQQIILVDSVKNDTIFSYKKTPYSIIIGDHIPKENQLSISNTLWQTDHISSKDVNDKTVKTSLNISFLTQDVMDIDGWKTTVLQQMIGLLTLSFLIFVFVIGLLYYSIKNLITQKKIADIKTDFVNNITHELKTPLATLSIATKMLKNPKVNTIPAQFDATVNTIDRQNKRLQKLIDQVLNNSLGYHEIKLQKTVVTIESYINTILDDFMLAVTSDNVSVNRNFSISTKSISIDKFYITTAIINILENAVKYSENRSVINFNVESDSKLKITIKDNGIGMSKEDEKHIFDKFFRAGNKEIHDIKGLGLGLFYTHQIIKAHHGTITVKSDKGLGTTFTITLPLDSI